MDNIFNIPKNKIRVIELKSGQRKLVHQYIEKYYPKLYKSSLRCDYFRSNIIHRFMKCYYCNYKNVLIDEYMEGVMGNNIDESMFGTCPRCKHTITFEINYDDWHEVHITRENNIIAFGYYFKGYTRCSHDEDVSLDGMQLKIYELDAPKEIMDKRTLSKYISSQISEGLYTII